MRSRPSRFSDWIVVHPVLWVVGSGVALVLLGFALNLAPIVVVAAGADIGVLNILHAKRRGYCPLPVDPGSTRSAARFGPPTDTSAPAVAFSSCTAPGSKFRSSRVQSITSRAAPQNRTSRESPPLSGEPGGELADGGDVAVRAQVGQMLLHGTPVERGPRYAVAGEPVQLPTVGP